MSQHKKRAPEQIRRPRRKRRKKRRIPLFPLLTAALLAFSLWKLTGELLDSYRSRQYLDRLAAQVVAENTHPAPEDTEPPRQNAPTEPVEFAPIQVNFQELARYYPDIAGWLYCPGTNINYPVVQAENNEYYMHRLPNGEESAGGSLFLDCTNDWNFADANSVIYGHDMKDGTMFGYLHNFDSQSYYEDHPVFYLLTPGRNYRMDIFCTAVVPSDSDLYAMRMEDGALQDWISKTASRSLICPNVPVNREAEHFLTLSTCSYEYENARFVVVGALKRIY